MRRKLLILPSSYPTEYTLVKGIFIQNQVDILSGAYDVVVLFPRLPSWRKLVRGEDRPKSQVEDRNGVKIYREEMILPPRLFRLRAYFYRRLARRGFKKILMAWGKPDMIHAHVVLPGGWVALNLGREFAIPVVLTEHSGPFSVHLKSAYQRRLVRETLMNVNRNIAVSPALAREMQAFCNLAKIEVVGNVIRTEFFVPAEDYSQDSSYSRTRFLSVALLVKEKGIHYLIEAVRLLIQKGITSFEVMIGGDGPARPMLEGMVKRMDLSDHCRFLGLLNQEEVKYWMQQCDVFVSPSLGETFGIALGEAMACGKPVIATRSGGSEFIMTDETGFFVNVADPAALAEMMGGFISKRITFTPDVIRQAVSNRFGEKAFLQKISVIYEQILAEYTEQRFGSAASH
ncbi:MAG: glycosyltransferase [Thermodesulfobacteriota bacterium]